jgi:hypothetical protein
MRKGHGGLGIDYGFGVNSEAVDRSLISAAVAPRTRSRHGI